MMFADEDGGDEEWDIIPRPSYGRMIPPPPSQPDDVEHCTQARPQTMRSNLSSSSSNTGSSNSSTPTCHSTNRGLQSLGAAL